MPLQPWHGQKKIQKFCEDQAQCKLNRLQNQLPQDVAILHTVMSKITSAVALIGMDITTVIVSFLNHGIPMAAFKHAPRCAGTHPHVVELVKLPEDHLAGVRLWD